MTSTQVIEMLALVGGGSYENTENAISGWEGGKFDFSHHVKQKKRLGIFPSIFQSIFQSHFSMSTVVSRNKQQPESLPGLQKPG